MRSLPVPSRPAARVGSAAAILLLATLLLCAKGAAAKDPAKPASSPPPAAASKAKPSQASGSSGSAAEGRDDPSEVIRQECADVAVSSSQLRLAGQADIVVTGVALAAGPGQGVCAKNGTLSPQLDQADEEPSGTSFILLGLQCVHKGMVQCRTNDVDAGDCVIVVETPVLPDSQPCALTGGQRYMFFLQRQTAGCPGRYLAMYQRAYHTIRRPLGGTGCAFYPSFPTEDDLVEQVNGCEQRVKCPADRCLPTVTRSPCANDTSVRCDLKLCEGKAMYFNAIMPSETCYELYTYRTSGLPVNCYGRRYINNRIAQIELAQALANATSSNSAAPGAKGG